MKDLHHVNVDNKDRNMSIENNQNQNVRFIPPYKGADMFPIS